MMGLLLRVLFVTTDVYEKVKLRRLKCIRTMRKQTKMLLRLPKNSSFFHNFLWPSEWGLYQNLRNCTANHVLCFLNQKTNIHVNFANVLWLAFSTASSSLYYHSWNTLYLYATLRYRRTNFLLEFWFEFGWICCFVQNNFFVIYEVFFSALTMQTRCNVETMEVYSIILGPWLKLIKIPF
jgi:hypothetical protein